MLSLLMVVLAGIVYCPNVIVGPGWKSSDLFMDKDKCKSLPLFWSWSILSHPVALHRIGDSESKNESGLCRSGSGRSSAYEHRLHQRCAQSRLVRLRGILCGTCSPLEVVKSTTCLLAHTKEAGISSGQFH